MQSSRSSAIVTGAASGLGKPPPGSGCGRGQVAVLDRQLDKAKRPWRPRLAAGAGVRYLPCGAA